MKKLSRMREWREKRKLTQVQLAEILRTHQTLISKWEGGQAPSRSSVARIAQALKVEERELL
jgi:transcriptional regulator with XRE-family HTH domain